MSFRFPYTNILAQKKKKKKSQRICIAKQNKYNHSKKCNIPTRSNHKLNKMNFKKFTVYMKGN